MLTGTSFITGTSQIAIPVRLNGLYPRVAATSGNRLLAPKVLTRVINTPSPDLLES
jgi:hypothetical protein